MNIFHLSESPLESAIWQHDKHVVKMTLETAQLVSQAIRLTPEWWDEFPDKSELYKTTHRHHPSAKWARQSVPNLFWLCKHGIYLAEEYEHRFLRTHASKKVIRRVLDSVPRLSELPCDNLTTFATALPDKYKVPQDPVSSYRRYYVAEKINDDSKWTLRRKDLPEWLFVPALVPLKEI